LEARVRSGGVSLLEDRLDLVGVEVGVELGSRRAGDAVLRPRLLEVGFRVEMVARVDVVVLRGHDVVVVVIGEHLRDGAGDPGAARDGERTALAEVVLYVYDDQCFGHGVPCTSTGTAGSPAESFSPSQGIEIRQRRRCSR